MIKETAVNNFLSSINLRESRLVHYLNAERDMALYRWNNETYEAIMRGIDLAYAKQEC